MFSKADIRRAIIAVTEKDYRALVAGLGTKGIVHLDRVITGENYVPAVEIMGVTSVVDSSAVMKIVSVARDFNKDLYSQQGGMPVTGDLPDDIPSLFNRDFEADLHDAERIKKKALQYERTRALVLDDLERAELKLARIRSMRMNGIHPEELSRLKLISYIYGKMSGNGILDTGDKPVYCIRNGEYILCLFPHDLKEELAGILSRQGFMELDPVTGKGYTPDEDEPAAEKRITDLKSRLARIDFFYREQFPQWQERMQYLESAYSVILEICGAESKFMFLKELVIINGWINAEDSGKVQGLLREICGDRFYFRAGSRRDSMSMKGGVPVLLKNNRFLRPFELLVKMMGLPGNSEVDPTPAAAIAYVMIFGVMFGDLGQGLVLALAGILLNKYGNRKYRPGNTVSDFGSIMAWCGFSAAFFGLLYGSVFSNEHIMPALLFHPMENIMKLLIMAVMMGALFITAGLVLNIVNASFSGRYAESILGSRGIPGLAVYALFVYFATRFIFAGRVPGAGEIAAALALPGALFCLRGPLEFIFFQKDRLFHSGLFEYIIETLVEIMEMFSGFLGNTISFIRAGAFALSHAGLSIAVFTLAGIVDPMLNSIGAISVIVTGNIFIILLEGLVCGIQSMRLEYYEFFSKFFIGDGISFSPFSFRFMHVKDGGVK